MSFHSDKLKLSESGNAVVLIIFIILLALVGAVVVNKSNIQHLLSDANNTIKKIEGNITKKEECLELSEDLGTSEIYPDKSIDDNLVTVFRGKNDARILYSMNLNNGCVKKLATYEYDIQTIIKAGSSNKIGIISDSTPEDKVDKTSNSKGFEMFEGNHYWIYDINGNKNEEVTKDTYEKIIVSREYDFYKYTYVEDAGNESYNLILSNVGNNGMSNGIYLTSSISKSDILKVCEQNLQECLNTLETGVAIVSPNDKFILFTIDGYGGGKDFILIYDISKSTLFKIGGLKSSSTGPTLFYWIDENKLISGGLEDKFTVFEINDRNISRSFISQETKNLQRINDFYGKFLSNDKNYYFLIDYSDNISQLLNLKTLELVTLMGPLRDPIREGSPIITLHQWIDNDNLSLFYRSNTKEFGGDNEYIYYIYNISGKNLYKVFKFKSKSGFGINPAFINIKN